MLHINILILNEKGILKTDSSLYNSSIYILCTISHNGYVLLLLTMWHYVQTLTVDPIDISLTVSHISSIMCVEAMLHW